MKVRFFTFQTDFNDSPNESSRSTFDGRRDIREIVPQSAETLIGVDLVANMFVMTYLKDAKSQVKMYSLDGDFVREVDFPELDTAADLAEKRTETETFYSFSSFATPPTIFSL